MTDYLPFPKTRITKNGVRLPGIYLKKKKLKYPDYFRFAVYLATVKIQSILRF